MDNLSWYGQIPSGWKEVKLGSIFKVRNERANDRDYAPLSVSKGGVVPQMDGVAKTDANDNRKLVLKDDFVINSRSDRKQSCGVAKRDGSVSLINTVLYYDHSVVAPDYVDLLLDNFGFAEEFYRWGHGIVADLWTTRWREMKNITVPLPPFDTQQKIAKFINHKSDLCDKLISIEQKEIDALSSLKLSIIDEKIKSNGQLIPLKRCADLQTETIGRKVAPDTPINYIDISSVNSYGEITNIQTMPFENAPSRAQRIVHDGDVIVSTVRTYLKAIARIESENDGCVCSTGFAVIKARPNIVSPDYLFYAVRSDEFTSLVSSYSYGISYPAINATDLMRLPIRLIPKDLQKSIVEEIKIKAKSIESIIKTKTNKIGALKQYKTSVIYESVIGKMGEN